MAFNISITKNKEVDFQKLNLICESLDREYVTVFPIHGNNFNKQQGVGLSINLKKEYNHFLNSLRDFLITMLKQNFDIIELYNIEKIEDENDIERLIKLLT